MQLNELNLPSLSFRFLHFLPLHGCGDGHDHGHGHHALHGYDRGHAHAKNDLPIFHDCGHTYLRDHVEIFFRGQFINFL